MTVRRSLFLSNILMIFVPVIAAALTGLFCVGVIWLSVVGGAGLDLHDAEDFNRVCLAVTEIIEHNLDSKANLTSLNVLLDNNGMRAQVLCGETEIYSYGTADENDGALKLAASGLTGNSVVSQNGRSLYKTYESIRGEDYIIYLLGGNHSESVYANLKVSIAVSVILIVFTIFLSILLTNRFLTKFVFRRVEEPLNILTNGVREIRDGNLDYRIRYDRPDEFRPICEDFNQMAARLKESIAKIQQQERSRKELLAGISHDIRSPLTSIKAYVEGLLDGVAKTPESQKNYLMSVKTKAEDLDQMISQLFLFSKMELGEYSDNMCSLKLDEKVEALVSDVRKEYENKGLHIDTKLTPITITADPIQLDRVIVNIMENSLKYKKNETGTLRITLTKTKNFCVLSFDDDGPGVPEEALPHLFEVFYRSDPARRNPQNGSGLGLAIVESIVSHMGGSALAGKSELGGLKIEICLPYLTCPSHEEGVKVDGENTNY